MDDPTPWVQLKNDLARQIDLGILEPGDEVSVIYEAQDRGMNRRTANKAFRALVEEGKLKAPQGVGKPYLVVVAGETVDE